MQQLFTAWPFFQAGWTRYFSGRTNSSEISAFSAKKKKLLLLKTAKIAPAGKTCRLPPKCVLMRQSYLRFFAARTFFLPLTLFFCRIQHLCRLPPAHMFTQEANQEAKPCRVHMLFYPTHNIHPASSNEVSSPWQNLAGHGFFSPNPALGWRMRHFATFKMVEPAKKRTVLQALKQGNVESGIQMMHLVLFCRMRHLFA